MSDVVGMAAVTEERPWSVLSKAAGVEYAELVSARWKKN